MVERGAEPAIGDTDIIIIKLELPGSRQVNYRPIRQVERGPGRQSARHNRVGRLGNRTDPRRPLRSGIAAGINNITGNIRDICHVNVCRRTFVAKTSVQSPAALATGNQQSNENNQHSRKPPRQKMHPFHCFLFFRQDTGNIPDTCDLNPGKVTDLSPIFEIIEL
jgi:hypothetical protein